MKERSDVWLRLQPTTTKQGQASRGGGINGVSTTADGPVEMFYGDSDVQDEGELLIAIRSLPRW